MDAKEVAAALAEPFEAADVKFKPQMVKNNRAMAIAYINARAVMDRLDEVLGVDGWSDAYTVLPSGEVECRLAACICGEWVTKCDVGSQSEQPDEGDRLKAAFSDALKRAAVKLGVGRYLYRLEPQWCDYDPVKKQFTQLPRLPDAAKPGPRVITADPAKALPAATPDPAAADLEARFRDHLRSIATCLTPDSLKAAWAAVRQDDFSDIQLAELTRAKDDRKARLAQRPAAATA